jgi:hypothetical protein
MVCPSTFIVVDGNPSDMSQPKSAGLCGAGFSLMMSGSK